MSRARSEAISPTAHYTGYVWFAHGQSHEAFATRTGRVMYHALRAPNRVAHRVKLPTLEGMLLARHRLIDLRLTQAIEAGEVSQIVEVAAGLSPRGWRFSRKYGDRITYVEADLPGMLARKRRVLAQLGGETPHHYTTEIDALAATGPTSIGEICSELDASRGVAIITEGLINYFDTDTVCGMWRRFSDALRPFPRGIYFTDLILRHGNDGALVNGFAWLLSAFVRGRVHMHFDSPEACEDALARCGFEGIVHDPRDFAFELPDLETAGAGRVRIIEALAQR
ncbi:MAG TPA: class I SAM-dependent methyltransferase [Kofleriaceae bacterium]|nr:class I SAM-dependent methyltransferase [Kofleriaceae bacterium]